MKRRRWGQHYLVDKEVINEIIKISSPFAGKTVLEIGCGKGALTEEILRTDCRLIGYEIDSGNFEFLLTKFKGRNAEFYNEDFLNCNTKFDVLISSLPYSVSSSFVEWLSLREYDKAVVVLQEDFVKKITSQPGSKDYRAISVIAQLTSDISKEIVVPRNSFFPMPRVNSRVVSFLFKMKSSERLNSFIKKLFTYKTKRVERALKLLGIRISSSFGERRVFNLSPREIYEIAMEAQI